MIENKKENKNNKRVRMLAYISLLALFFLNFSFSFFGIVINGIFLFGGFLLLKTTDLYNQQSQRRITVIALIIEVFFLYAFVQRWDDSPMVLSLLSLLKLPINVLLYVLGALFCVLSFPALLMLLEAVGKEEVRVSTGFDELDRVLGGGLVSGSLVLIGGEPGIGKSTLILQLCDKVQGEGNVLYVSGEESAEQIKIRADRLGINNSSIMFAN